LGNNLKSERDFYTIIETITKKGKNLNIRLYYEEKCSCEQMFHTELYYVFLNSFKHNYRVFHIHCLPTHNIQFSKSELDFLSSRIKSEGGDEIIENHIFSEEVIKIKELQYLDLTQIYNLSVKNNTIGAFFMYPFLSNNNYCFNIFLIVTDKFNLNEFFDLKFNVIKVNSCVEYYENNLSLDFLEKTYNLDLLKFRDYIIPYKEIEKTTPYNIFDLEEKKELDRYLDFLCKWMDKNLQPIPKELEKQEMFLIEKLRKKKTELWDIDLYKKLLFQKLCLHFYVFHKEVVDDSGFFTNLFQLGGAHQIDLQNNVID
jgi:hypothetical protein